jgi:curved DNA-binding protein CbpA
MAARSRDPYETLGVEPDVSDDQLRTAYRQLVQLHHPDHNGGSAESAHHFEQIQDAYAQIRELREVEPGASRTPPSDGVDPGVESRIAALQQELREAQLARERARQAAREASSDRPNRPSDEELGYVTTDDSFSKILADARSELSERFSEARERPAVRRVRDLIDELDDVADKLSRKPPPRAR